MDDAFDTAFEFISNGLYRAAFVVETRMISCPDASIDTAEGDV